MSKMLVETAKLLEYFFPSYALLLDLSGQRYRAVEKLRNISRVIFSGDTFPREWVHYRSRKPVGATFIARETRIRVCRSLPAIGTVRSRHGVQRHSLAEPREVLDG